MCCWKRLFSRFIIHSISLIILQSTLVSRASFVNSAALLCSIIEKKLYMHIQCFRYDFWWWRRWFDDMMMVRFCNISQYGEFAHAFVCMSPYIFAIFFCCLTFYKNNILLQEKRFPFACISTFFLMLTKIWHDNMSTACLSGTSCQWCKFIIRVHACTLKICLFWSSLRNLTNRLLMWLFILIFSYDNIVCEMRNAHHFF